VDAVLARDAAGRGLAATGVGAEALTGTAVAWTDNGCAPVFADALGAGWAGEAATGVGRGDAATGVG